MELKDAIVAIRNRQGISQEETAAKLSVTRQTVSKWESGETTPDVKTIKKISNVFNTSESDLLGLKNSSVCQSCGMNMQNAEDFGTNAGGGICTDYCKYCMQNGAFTHNRTIDETVEANLQFLDEYNKGSGLKLTPDQARIEFKKRLSTLKRWR